MGICAEGVALQLLLLLLTDLLVLLLLTVFSFSRAAHCIGGAGPVITPLDTIWPMAVHPGGGDAGAD